MSIRPVVLDTKKTGDLLPDLRMRLLIGGVPVDISSAVGATVSVGSGISRAAVIDDDGTPENRGLLSLPWQAGDTDTSGVFDVEVRLEWVPGKEQTFPSDRTRTVVRITDGLA